MNDTELNENFYKACLRYATIEGPTPIVTAENVHDTFCVINYSNSTYEIGEWNHASTQPTRTQLKTYTVEQVEDTWKQYLKANIYTHPLSSVGTFSLNFSGPWATPQQVTVAYTARVDAIMMNFPKTSATSDSSGGTISSSSTIDYLYRPPNNLCYPVIVKDNGTNTHGCLEVTSSGYINFYKDLNGSEFTNNSGVYGFEATSISYKVV